MHMTWGQEGLHAGHFERWKGTLDIQGQEHKEDWSPWPYMASGMAEIQDKGNAVSLETLQAQVQEGLECLTRGLSCYPKRDGKLKRNLTDTWAKVIWVKFTPWWPWEGRRKGLTWMLWWYRDKRFGSGVKLWKILVHNPSCWTPRVMEAPAGCQLLLHSAPEPHRLRRTGETRLGKPGF